eukprot:CAMPEP_0202488806 /NCGR_PEP_ID=MMETSP1361-20130828/6753_1 /ASSEMBLY_ACC=CAM_ASM_000849 /TAXON_ID=210615 /ORGANISM="Staurosira complex sp., Strain CCMP2646" /LENGTH=218 /DNA_ID=CAMNT_0049118461 /DNA_START=70 /DNA_END=726 /DNA_ORIENTATION=-
MTVKRSSPFRVPVESQQQQHMPTLKRARLDLTSVGSQPRTCLCEATSSTGSRTKALVTPLVTAQNHPSNPFRQLYSFADDLDLSPLTLERAVTLEEPCSSDDEVITSTFNKPRFTLRMRPTFGSTNPFIKEFFHQDEEQTGFLTDDEGIYHARRVQLLPPRMALDIRNDQDFVLETPRPSSSSFIELRSPPKIQRRNSEPVISCDAPLREELKLPMLA